MSTVLRNNAVVIALVVIALAVVYLRIVSPLLARSEADVPVLAEDIDEAIDEYESADAGVVHDIDFASAQYDIGHFRTTDLHWNEQPSRDPFTPLVQIEARDIDAVQQKVQAAPEQRDRPVNAPMPVVNAIVNSESYRYAVIDGEILTVGDRLGDFRVEQINRRTVSLKLKGNNQLVNVTVTE